MSEPETLLITKVADFLLGCTLRQISQLQTLLAKEGIELHLGTGSIQTEEFIEEDPSGANSRFQSNERR